jgi:hypothetical protein
LGLVELSPMECAGRFPDDEAVGVEYGWHVWEPKQVYVIGSALGRALREGRWFTREEQDAIRRCGIPTPAWWTPQRRAVARVTWTRRRVRVEYHDLSKPFNALGASNVECLKVRPRTFEEVALYPRERNTNVQRAIDYLDAVKVAPYSYAGSIPRDALVGAEYGPHVWSAKQLFVIGKALSDRGSLTEDEHEFIRLWGVRMPAWWTPDRRAVTRVTWPQGRIEYHDLQKRVAEDPRIEPKIERLTAALWTGNEIRAGAALSLPSTIACAKRKPGAPIGALMPPPAPREMRRRERPFFPEIAWG